MHHSFMEYFAAVGLSRELEKCDIMSLVSEPRWREVLTLLAGIIGENKDVAPVLARIIDGDDHLKDIDARVLIFSLDCAIECEVPSEAAINLLCSAIAKCVRQGPARIDHWVRDEIGNRLVQLGESCGFSALKPMLLDLIMDPDADTCAASISLASKICATESIDIELLHAVEASADRSEERVLSAICGFVGSVEWARTATLMQLMERCLKKTVRCKLSAFEALVEIPGMPVKHWPDIINGLEDKDSSVRQIASKVALAAGLDADVATLADAKKDLVTNAFRNVVEAWEDEEEFSVPKIADVTIDKLLRSSLNRDRLIGIQLLPYSVNAREHAYSKLFEIIESPGDHQEVTTALSAVRSSSHVKLRVTIGDLRKVAKLSTEGTLDVRKASVALLGCFGNEIIAIQPLVTKGLTNLDASEYVVRVNAMGRSHVLQEDIARLLEDEIEHRTRKGISFNKDYKSEMRSLLVAAWHLCIKLRPAITSIIRDLVNDRRQPKSVKKSAMLAYAATSIPSKHSVAFFSELLATTTTPLLFTLAQSLTSLAKSCCQSVEYVIATIEPLSDLLKNAISVHRRVSKWEDKFEAELVATELRAGICKIEEILTAFEEFVNSASSDSSSTRA